MKNTKPTGYPEISFFLPNLEGGGAEKVITTLGNELARQGYIVEFVLVKAVGVNLGSLSAGIQIVDLGAKNSYLCLPKLIRYFQRRHPALLISSLDLTNIMALIARRLAGVKTRILIRIENMTSSQKRVTWKKYIEKILLTRLYPWADGIITVSRKVADDLAEYAGISPSKIHTIYTPVITPALMEMSLENLAHPWFQPGEIPVILGAGRLTEQKDFKTLIMAFSILRQELEVRLVILGEGEKRLELETLSQTLGVAHDIDLPGYVENPYSYMHQAGVFVLSSAWEGLPTVLIAALACGCPVVSTDCPGGISEILSNGTYGEIVPVGDPQAMANAIGRAIKEGKINIEAGWLEQFSLEKIVEQTIEYIAPHIKKTG